MQIISATLSDLEDLTQLFDGYRKFYKQSSDIEAAREFLKERLNHHQSRCLICKDENGIAMGFTQLYPTFSSVSMQHNWILNDLFVHPDHRSKGVGKALLLAAQRFAREDGAKGLVLETATDNPAQHLYEALGWKKDTEVFHYTWKVEN
ncbi:GNAT family N-acetyltransferase [Aureitalea marina]|uniref:GNAT family N-acetyltransferase n=1 Tax=Aureitalea marina TaxID=930804 RepID=A0A2S7KN68_9FLAO|nr:GNAT family N-acetyltransferase [Aureitalea marina]PQB04003.1 GNAT family N-acetyltransferase [Aureitalea marina]